MPDLKVLLISDGRPGHFNLSEGIVAAMARRRSVQVARVEVKRRKLVSGYVGAGLFRAGVSPAWVLHLAHGLVGTDVPVADVIVSAGAETLPANVAAARLFGVPNIFYGSLRAYSPAWFELVLTSYAAQVADPHPVMTLKPSRLDPDSLPVLAARGWGEYRPPTVAGLLIGGDSGSGRFEASDWSGLLDLVAMTHASWGTRWIVANSRRTPGVVSDRFADVAGQLAGPMARFIDVRSTGSGTLRELFASAEMVAVTADSSSMLSEAVWSRRPTVALAPRNHVLTPMEEAYRRHMEHAGYCRSLAIREATPAHLLAALSTITPLADNPLEALADLLERRVPILLGDITAISGP